MPKLQQRRPRVICHMMSSIDGRIVTTTWPDMGDGRKEYERIHAQYDADAWMCGRVTMEPFAGAVRAPAEVAREVDLGNALENLAADFDIKTVMLEGGGKINGGMLRDGLIDEVSLLVAPLADGAIGTPSLFDVEGADGAHRARKLELLGVEQRSGGVLWLRYGVVQAPSKVGTIK